MVRDSVKVDEQLLTRFDSLAASVGSLHSEEAGDLTTVLTVQRGEKLARLSFPGVQVPASYPAPVRELISALKNLHAR